MKKSKKVLALVLVLAMACAAILTGCNGSNDGGSKDTAESNVNNKAIMVVSFGTSFDNSRNITIGGIEAAIREAFPDWQVRRAFTSQIIIDHIKKDSDIEIDNVEKALKRAKEDGVKELVVQPTHLMDGLEYNELKDELEKHKDDFDKVVLSKPLLTTDDDFKNVIKAITSAHESEDNGKTAICFMGHGTEAKSNSVYKKMNDMLHEEGFENFYVGTVEASPTFQDVIDEANKHGGYTDAVLSPLMVVAGDHANNDMADMEDEESWASMFKEAGYNVRCNIEGLGSNWNIQQIYVDHVQAAIDELNK